MDARTTAPATDVGSRRRIGLAGPPGRRRNRAHGSRVGEGSELPAHQRLGNVTRCRCAVVLASRFNRPHRSEHRAGTIPTAVQLTTESGLGNIYFAGDDAWTSSADIGSVYRVTGTGTTTTYALDPGVGEMAPTTDTMWVTNANSGALVGIDIVDRPAGQDDRHRTCDLGRCGRRGPDHGRRGTNAR